LGAEARAPSRPFGNRRRLVCPLVLRRRHIRVLFAAPEARYHPPQSLTRPPLGCPPSDETCVPSFSPSPPGTPAPPPGPLFTDVWVGGHPISLNSLDRSHVLAIPFSVWSLGHRQNVFFCVPTLCVSAISYFDRSDDIHMRPNAELKSTALK